MTDMYKQAFAEILESESSNKQAVNRDTIAELFGKDWVDNEQITPPNDIKVPRALHRKRTALNKHTGIKNADKKRYYRLKPEHKINNGEPLRKRTYRQSDADHLITKQAAISVGQNVSEFIRSALNHYKNHLKAINDKSTELLSIEIPKDAQQE